MGPGGRRFGLGDGRTGNDISTLTAARVLQGADSATSMVVSRSMVQDLCTDAQRTRVMACIGMALGMCPPMTTLGLKTAVALNRCHITS